jgi:hypothetical protein
MTINLEEESFQRLHNAFEATRVIDTGVCHNSVDREYQLELIRILKHEARLTVDASIDQRIARTLLSLGYSPNEIESSIIRNSPMAVKPAEQQRQFYAKSIAQKAISSKSYKCNQKSAHNISQHLCPDLMGWNGELPKQESFFIRPTYSIHEIQSAMAKLLRVREDVVLIVNTDEHEIPALSDSILYLIDFSSALGDFPVRLSIYPQLPAFDQWHADDHERIAFIGHFCNLLSCEALTEGNESPNIDQGWIIIKGFGVSQSVILDSERIIDDGSLVIRSNAGDAS